jgi:hypothetical protein
VAPAELKALKQLALDRGQSMAELVRVAIDNQYGDIVGELVVRLPSVSATAHKHARKGN